MKGRGSVGPLGQCWSVDRERKMPLILAIPNQERGSHSYGCIENPILGLCMIKCGKKVLSSFLDNLSLARMEKGRLKSPSPLTLKGAGAVSSSGPR